MISVFIFFGFIGVSIAILLIVNKIASKYLNGDFVKDSPEREYEVPCFDDVEPGCKNPLTQESPRMKGSQVEVFSDQIALTRIKDEGFADKFASNAKVMFKLNYNKATSVLYGTILSLDGLSSKEKSPDVIRFHVKITPNKYKTKTIWKGITVKTLTMTFELGPVKRDIDINSNICMRLYGKKTTFGARAKCYGECLVPLRKILTSDGELQFCRNIFPKATRTNQTSSTASSESLLVASTDDSEKE